ncbi:MAG: dTMP kinase [Pirellulales bacterium]|nr:dTMP kinase [Pirellulales bacterium]
MFFSFDGIDGVGKTTQIALLDQQLRARGHAVVVCRDPGSTPLGERVREVLLASGPEVPIAPRTEMFLYMAARAQLVEQVITPALAAGQIVISDRYLLANVVYQGHAGGLDPELVWQVGRVATNGLLPDRVFLLDMPPGEAGQRIDRPLDRMESRGNDFRQRLRAGFLAEAARDPSIHVIPADRPVEMVQADIWSAVEQCLGTAR